MPRVRICDNTLNLPYEAGLDAYAVYDSVDKTLTFFRDRPNTYTNGQVIGTKTYYSGIERYSNARWSGKSSLIQNVYVEDIISPEYTRNWFANIPATVIDGLGLLDTSKTKDMSYMFYNCPNLQIIDVSSFDTSNVIETANMFRRCPSLTTIYGSEQFVTTQVTDSSYMFYESTNLVGGNGTRYTERYIGKAYARIDNPPNSPGYFTAKGE